MILVNQNKLESDAYTNEANPMHVYAVEVERGLKELRKRFPEGKIKFVRPGYPKYTDGLTAKGIEVKGIPVPTTPAHYPLRTQFKHPERGSELWVCSVDAPKILPGNLWDIGGTRYFAIEDSKTIDLKTEPDLAFYLCYISNAVKSGQIKIDDPKADIKAKADIERQEIERKTAIWNLLQDEGQLRKICLAYNIDDQQKEPDALRFELQVLLKINDEKQKRDPSVHGTKEFLEEMKITDNVRLRAFIREGIKNGLIVYNQDGRYKSGDKVILQVPIQEISRKFDYLCNNLSAPNNVEKLQSLMVDLVNKEYLDKIEDEKDYRWLAKVMAIDGYYNKANDKVKEMVFQHFGF